MFSPENELNIYFLSFILGISGSFHCVAMCLPLSMFFNKQNSRLQSLLFYGSKVFAYIFLGVLSASVGLFFKFLGYVEYFSILIGVLIIANVFTGMLNHVGLQNMHQKLMQFVRLEKKPILKSIFWGFSNGLIPCGLSYSVAFSAATTYSLNKATFLMIAFGLGTTTVLLSANYIKNIFFLDKIKIDTKWISVCIGLFIIYRGVSTQLFKAETNSKSKFECNLGLIHKK